MDLELAELNNGGDLLKKGNDLAMVFGFENMPYLALFGGNKGFPTPQKRLPSEQAFDYWANSLLLKPDTQFNSLTESTLDNVGLTSAGRILIEEAVKKDLEFMKPFAEIKVDVTLISDDFINIRILIKQPDNLQEKEFIFIWDATAAALLTKGPPLTPILRPEFLQYELQFLL